MTLEEARAIVVAIDAEVKKLWPDAWAMFVVTVGGHIQFSICRPERHPYTTFDIPADAPDWLAKFHEGAALMRTALDELRARKARGEE
jgi:hypothetical protein